MNDQHDSETDDSTDTTENPLNGDSPYSYDEAEYTDDKARALYDAYLMLRDYGYDPDDLMPLMFALEKLTIYEGSDPEGLRIRFEIENAEDLNE